MSDDRGRPPGAPPGAPWPAQPGQLPQSQPQPPQQQWQQPPQSGVQPYPGAAPQPYPAAAPQPYPSAPAQPYPGGASLKPYPLIMQQRITRLTGHMFVAPARLYFICESQKGGLAVAIGQGVGGLLGGALAALAAPTPGQAAPVIDEAMLHQAAQEKPGSLVMEPAKVKQIKETMWWRGIWYDGKTYGLPKGLSKELNQQLAIWCQANNVKNAGLKLPKA